MALYEHPVNTARERAAIRCQQRLAVGRGNAAGARQPGPWRSVRVSADDPVALGLARLAGMRHRAPGEGAVAWLERAPEDGRHLVVLEACAARWRWATPRRSSAGCASWKTRWFAPLLAALSAAASAW